MKFKAYIGEAEHDIEVEPIPGGYVVSIDGVAHEVDTAYRGASFYSLVSDHRSYDVAVHDEGPDTYTVRHGGFARKLRIVNPLVVAAGARTVPAGPVPVRAVMPGRVVKLLVDEGAEVRAEQPLLVLEAMKMENDILAPKDGRVTQVRVTAGQAVENAETLLVVE